jgi:hypothetical protein
MLPLLFLFALFAHSAPLRTTGARTAQLFNSVMAHLF